MKTVQYLAIAGQVKDDTRARMAQLLHVAGQEGMFRGLKRDYRKRFPEENGVQYPPESQKVRVTAADVLDMLGTVMTRQLDLALTLDTANAASKSDVTVGGERLLRDVPVTHLLYLANQLEEVRKVIAALPELDPGKDWDVKDMPPGQYRAPAVESPKREKVPGKFVLYEATKEHPAQVQRLDTDEVTGYWTEVAFSGAIDPKRKLLLLARVDELAAAVKMAREDANTASAPERKEGEVIFGWLTRP